MKFLIDTLSGETVEAELRDIEDMYWGSEVVGINGTPCRLGTERSLEAEAVKSLCNLLWETRSYALRQVALPEDLRRRLEDVLNNTARVAREVGAQ